MTTQVQLRRGDTDATAAFTGAEAELTVVTDDWSLRVHDGITPGGHPVGGSSTTAAGPLTTFIEYYYTGNPVVTLNGGVIRDTMFASRPVVGHNFLDTAVYVSDGNPGAITIDFGDGGTSSTLYRMSTSVRVVLSQDMPDNAAISYGSFLTVNAPDGGGAVGLDRHQHNHSMVGSGAVAAATVNGSQVALTSTRTLTWTDEYTLNVIGPMGVTPGLAMYSYGHESDAIAEVAVFITLTRINSAPHAPVPVFP